MPNPALLDVSRLEIALGGDTSMIGDILEMYESTASADLQALKRAVQTADSDASLRKAHSLKGASANVGADHVAEIASRIELASREGALDNAVALLSTLEQVFGDTLRACRAHRAA